MASSIASEVVIGPGTYNVSGAVLARDTTLRLDPAATLVGNMTANVVQNATTTVTANTTAGSVIVGVADSSSLRVGDAVNIRDAGPLFDGYREPTYTTVTAINSPTSITVAQAPVNTLAATTLTAGASNVVITGGGTIDGNKGATDGENHFPVLMTTGANCHVIGINAINGDHGCVMFRYGCQGGSIRDNTITGIGFPALGLGCGVWLYKGTRGVTVDGNTISDGTGGIGIDDRTSGPDWTDAAATDNVITNNVITNVTNIGIGAEGCSRNEIRGNTVSGPQWGCLIIRSTQGTQRRQASDNIVIDNTFIDCTIGLQLEGANTTQAGNTFTNCTTNIVDLEP